MLQNHVLVKIHSFKAEDRPCLGAQRSTDRASASITHAAWRSMPSELGAASEEIIAVA